MFESNRLYLLGKCYKGLENRAEAERAFLQSLKIKPSQTHVFEQFLTIKEGNWDTVIKIIDDLPFETEQLWLKDFYKLKNTKQALDVFIQQDEQEKLVMMNQKENRLVPTQQKIEIECEKSLNPVIKTLIDKRNIEVLCLKADSLFKNYELGEAYKICKIILTVDSFHFPTLLIFSELLVERKVKLI